MHSIRNSYCLPNVLLVYSLVHWDSFWWAHSAAQRRKLEAWNPPRLPALASGAMLVQVLELDEQACTHGEVVASVA